MHSRLFLLLALIATAVSVAAVLGDGWPPF
jgi:hypothetical protein